MSSQRTCIPLNRHRYYIGVLCSLVCAMCSCSTVPSIQQTDCMPVPLPECKPGEYNTIAIDTAHIGADGYKYHIDLLPAPINSNDNDYAITFLSDNRAVVTAERGGVHRHHDSRRDDDSLVLMQRMLATRLLPQLQFDSLLEYLGTDLFETVGAAAYCQADHLLYFTVKAQNDDADDYDIYSASFDVISHEPRLTSVYPLTQANMLHTFDGQPAVSPDGLTLVFASDRQGGFGGVDLWECTRASIAAQWSEPHSVSLLINTACDEVTPSFSRDGHTLFFASNGHSTVGGYDLFSATNVGGKWSNVKNLGMPINSTADEVFPCQLSDSQFFFSSNQHAIYGGMNLFVLRRTKMLTSAVALARQPPDSIKLVGAVTLPVSHDAPPPDVFVRDVAKNEEIARKQTDTVGAYSFTVASGRQYDVGAETSDKFYDVHRVDLRKAVDSVVAVATLAIPDTLVIRINFPFDDATHPYDFVYDDAGAKTDTRWQSSLDLLAHSIKRSSKTLKNVLLVGNTDSLGSDEYNNALARRRAQFVATELQKRGIASRLLIISSKGRTTPVARRADEDDQTYQLRCRRVEFVKIFAKERQ